MKDKSIIPPLFLIFLLTTTFVVDAAPDKISDENVIALLKKMENMLNEVKVLLEQTKVVKTETEKVKLKTEMVKLEIEANNRKRDEKIEENKIGIQKTNRDLAVHINKVKNELDAKINNVTGCIEGHLKHLTAYVSQAHGLMIQNPPPPLSSLEGIYRGNCR